MEQPVAWQGGPEVPSTTWRGGADVPSMLFGRVNVSWPLASLSVSLSGLVLTVARKRFALSRDDVVAVYPCRRSLVVNGIGIETRDGQVLIFRTTGDHAVLPALQGAGFPVSFQPRKVYEAIRAARRRADPTGSARGRFDLQGVLFFVVLPLAAVLLKPVLAPEFSWTTVILFWSVYTVVNGWFYLRRR